MGSLRDFSKCNRSYRPRSADPDCLARSRIQYAYTRAILVWIPVSTPSTMPEEHMSRGHHLSFSPTRLTIGMTSFKTLRNNFVRSHKSARIQVVHDILHQNVHYRLSHRARERHMIPAEPVSTRSTAALFAHAHCRQNIVPRTWADFIIIILQTPQEWVRRRKPKRGEGGFARRTAIMR